MSGFHLCFQLQELDWHGTAFETYLRLLFNYLFKNLTQTLGILLVSPTTKPERFGACLRPSGAQLASLG